MKIKWGALVVDGRNKIGGHVASKNRGGSYLRTKVTPVNPQTAAQTAVRNSFGGFSQAWSGLSASLINQWNAAVSDWQTTDIFGDLKKPTGKNLFLKLNQSATQAGFSSFTTVPAKTDMVSGAITAATIDIGLTTLSLTGADTSGAANIVVYATPVVSAGTTFVKNKLRKIYAVDDSAFIAADAYTAFQSRFGTINLGDKVYVGIKYVLSNGQASPMQIIQATVVEN